MVNIYFHFHCSYNMKYYPRMLSWLVSHLETVIGELLELTYFGKDVKNTMRWDFKKMLLTDNEFSISEETPPFRNSWTWAPVITCACAQIHLFRVSGWMTVQSNWTHSCMSASVLSYMYSCMQGTTRTQTEVQQRAQMYIDEMIHTHAHLGQLTFHLWFVLRQAPLLLPQLPMWCHHLWPLGSCLSLRPPFLNCFSPTVSRPGTLSTWQLSPTVLSVTFHRWPLCLSCSTAVGSELASVPTDCSWQGCQWYLCVCAVFWDSDMNVGP